MLNADKPLITCFLETEMLRDIKQHQKPHTTHDELKRIVVTRRHDHEGYFIGDGAGALTTYKCSNCGARRVYGHVPEGPMVDEIEMWSKLPYREDLLEAQGER